MVQHITAQRPSTCQAIDYARALPLLLAVGVQGDAGQLIVDIAQKEQADILVLGAYLTCAVPCSPGVLRTSTKCKDSSLSNRTSKCKRIVESARKGGGLVKQAAASAAQPAPYCSHQQSDAGERHPAAPQQLGSRCSPLACDACLLVSLSYPHNPNCGTILLCCCCHYIHSFPWP
jgi:hypothetical protein